MIKNTIASFIIFVTLAALPVMSSASPCQGRFPNPITDVAWRSIFPLKIGSAPVAGADMEDTGPDAPLICVCPKATFPWFRIGIGISFYEPYRTAEVVRDDFCAPLLGGISLADMEGILKDGKGNATGEGRGVGFYNVHWYVYPLMMWMGMFVDSACQTNDSFDVMMISELDAIWNDDELSTIFFPESVLFANVPAQVACAADCVAASVHFPIDYLMWCGGCNGPSIYPVTGNVIGHTSGLQSSSLLVQRMHTKLHRSYVALDHGDHAGMCVPHPMPIIPKSRYKSQLLYPIPVTDKARPYGRSTALWGVAKEFPIGGEDFGYLLWRKRLCCVSN